VRWSREGDIDRQPSSSALAGQQQQQQQQQQSGAEGGAAVVAAPLMARSSISRSNSIAIPPERLLVEGGRLSSPEGGEEDGDGDGVAGGGEKEKGEDQMGSYGGWI
jgi:hypothetical protein